MRDDRRVGFEEFKEFEEFEEFERLGRRREQILYLHDRCGGIGH